MRVNSTVGLAMPTTTDARRDPWFCLPVLLAMLLDAGVTLVMQPQAYWSNPAEFQEGNASWSLLLARGPLAFVVGFRLYCLVIAVLILWFKGALQKLLGMFVLLAHSYGAASWCHIWASEDVSWLFLMGTLLAQAVGFSLYWRLSEIRRGARPGEAETG